MKKFKKKLLLNKTDIMSLNRKHMKEIIGGSRLMTNCYLHPDCQSRPCDPISNYCPTAIIEQCESQYLPACDPYPI